MRTVLLLLVSLALTAPVSGQADQATPDRGPGASQDTAVVRGRVVQAGTGVPLPRARVTLSGDQYPRREVTTDADGRYEFPDLPAGRFTITAAKGGYLTLQHGQRRPFEPGRAVTVAAAQVIDRVDLVLPRSGAISGRVGDERGEPVVGAEIQVERYQYDAGGARRLNRVLLGYPLMTNDLGEFRAFGLMPGEYVVSANLRQMPPLPGDPGPTGTVRAPLPTYYPGTANTGEALSVAVGLGEEASVQFTMVHGRLSRISGTIVDSTGRPAAGANLMLATKTSNSVGVFGRGSGTSATDGSFNIGDVPPGEHFIQVRLQPPAGSGLPAEVANVPIVVAGENVTGYRIATSAGATVSGRVEWEGTAPRTGAPAGNRLRIMANAADGRPALVGFVGLADATSDGTVATDNTFRITGLLGSVLVTPTGVPPQWTLKGVFAHGVDITSVGTDAMGLGADAEVRIVLTDKVTELTGSVRNARGEPATDYVVVAFPEEPVESSVAAGYTRTARPDQRGAFSLRALPPGRYRAVAVEALDQGAEWDPAFQAMVRDAARRFAIAEGQRLTLDLEILP